MLTMFQVVEHLFTLKEVILIVGALLGFAIQWGMLLGWKKEVALQHEDFKKQAKSMDDRIRQLEDDKTNFALLKQHVESISGKLETLLQKWDKQEELIQEFYRNYDMSKITRKRK